MTEKERTRYMRIDQQIFKTTFYLEKLIKDGYNVMLVSSRLHKIKDLIRNKDKNYFPLSGKTAEEKAERDDMPNHPVGAKRSLSRTGQFE